MAAALAGCLGIWAADANAAAAGGGLAPSGTPRLSDATCMSRCVSARKATPGATVRLTGSYLDETSRVVFKGVSKPVVATYKSRTSSTVEVVVPAEATSGYPRVVSETGLRSNASPKLLEVVPASALPKQVFPVRGPHEYWAGFGDGRGHEGADIGAACGTPLVAVAAGTLTKSEYHPRAGNYLVIDLKRTDQDLAYMHMTELTTLKVGTPVSAGQVVGFTGDSGNASGCHLHFELWEGEYYGGGAPVDPIPFLKSLEPRAKRK
ncbi:MAG TPA: peptidoglycan DD-metalloendopeptidase family protein [Solirubrobacterales bacterium]|nr:peptidoglycan DD-metalloendopeptidase family protein [Solirubrobacterales bacterium]